MKLLVVSHSCVTPVNQQLYAAVQEKTGWDITLVVPSNWKDEFGRRLAVQRWPNFKGELLGVPVIRSGNIILHAYRTSFTRLLRKIRPDAIYVNHEPYAVATAQVYTANQFGGAVPIGCYSCQNIQKRYPPPFRWTESKVLKWSRFFLPISAAVENVFRTKGYRGDSTILPLAIDTDMYRPFIDSTIRDRLRGNDEVVVGYVGRFVPEKGLLTLLKAAAKVNGLSWTLVFIGGGPIEPELRRRVDELGLKDRVQFVGFIPHEEVAASIAALDVLVLPSETQANWKEQFGRVLLEAMACGTAVLGSDSGEIPTLIRETGGGLVFRERDATDLAEQLAKLVRSADLRQTLSDTGLKAVQSRFSIHVLADQFIRTIQAAVTEKPDSRMAVGAGAK